jgi:Tfp pilus assembly pilus retraction ATPase PilT
MDDAIQTLRRTLRNPFVQNRVDSAWDARAIAADVPAINDDAFQQVLRTIADVRSSRQSHGLLLAGEPGSGKTHGSSTSCPSPRPIASSATCSRPPRRTSRAARRRRTA